MQIGSQTVDTINETDGTWSGVNRAAGYRFFRIWSKQSRSKGIEIEYQPDEEDEEDEEGYIIGTGFRRD